MKGILTRRRRTVQADDLTHLDNKVRGTWGKQKYLQGNGDIRKGWERATRRGEANDWEDGHVGGEQDEEVDHRFVDVGCCLEI